MSERRQELAQHWHDVQYRVTQACLRAGRAADEVTVIAVTKTWPASDLRLLSELGVRDFGESKEQEGHAKFGDLADRPSLHWHFIGQIQRNKASRIAEWADVIHSVDRIELLAPLARPGRSLDLLIQVNLDDALGARTRGRGGASGEQVLALAEAIAATPALHLRGLMLVPPAEIAPERAFEAGARVHQELLASYPEARWFSAGMSSDFETAIAYGATHVRIGSSILGSRY